ncbi:hypothetical protein [Chryseobacterium vaccae]|nr:hypothetical protein [Chryseobacterium vaccae]
MKKSPCKIYFLNNPYPDGHEIIDFVWSGRIDDDEFAHLNSKHH